MDNFEFLMSCVKEGKLSKKSALEILDKQAEILVMMEVTTPMPMHVAVTQATQALVIVTEITMAYLKLHFILSLAIFYILFYTF